MRVTTESLSDTATLTSYLLDDAPTTLSLIHIFLDAVARICPPGGISDGAAWPSGHLA